jgi:CHAT domain-containing protein/tetratricopeptide (TPR) repeat protein
MRAWPALAVVLLAAAAAGSSPSTEEQIRELLAGARFAEAEAMAREEASRLARTEGPGSEGRARALELLVRALLGEGRAAEPETEQLLEEAIAIQRRLHGKGSAAAAAPLLQRSVLLLHRGDLAGARAVAEEVLEVQERALGRAHPDLIATLRQVGTVCKELSDLACAGTAFTREAELIDRHVGAEHLDAAGNAYSRGWLAVEQADYEEAERLFRQALGVVERLQGPDAPRVAWTLIGLGFALDLQGDTARAIAVHERASAIVEKTLGRKHPMYASCQTNLGYTLARAPDLPRAEEVVRSALAASEASYGQEHEITARTAMTLADVLRQLGRRKEAAAQLERARAVFEHAGNAYLLIEARIKAAELVRDGGDAEAALRELEAARTDLARVLPGHADLRLDAEIGKLLLSRADLPGAAAAFSRALSDAHRLGIEDSPEALAAAAGLARTRQRQGRVDEAFTLAAEAERRSIERTRILLAGLAERPALEAATARATGLPVTTSVAVAARSGPRAREAWDLVVRSRAAVLDELAGRVASARDGAPEAWREFSTASRRLANLLVRDVGEEPPSASVMARARADRDAAETKLARASGSFARRRAARHRGLAEVLEARPRGAAVIAFAIYLRPGEREVEGYAAFVVSPSHPQPVVVDLGPAEALESAVGRWRDAVASGLITRSAAQEPAYRQTAATLRRLVWDPLEPLLGSAAEVAIVPEGPLHLVTFGALPASGSAYLVERRVFRYLSSERDLAEPAATANRESLLAVGGPDFDGATRSAGATYRGRPVRCGAFAGHRFDALEGAAAEARDVAAGWTRSASGARALLLQGSDASEARVKAEVSRHTVVHLATHGFFLDASCGRVPGGRGIGGLAPVALPSGAGDGPLALAGLALAGANLRQSAGPDDEDGILTAEEVAALDLSQARWVVLSGCDTGLGTIRSGEGVLGLRRALRVAGASTVVMSLWPVKDDTTRVWMEALYAARGAHGGDAAAAATEASRTVLARRREAGQSTHPAEWAAFVVSGQERGAQ